MWPLRCSICLVCLADRRMSLDWHQSRISSTLTGIELPPPHLPQLVQVEGYCSVVPETNRLLCLGGVGGTQREREREKRERERDSS